MSSYKVYLVKSAFLWEKKSQRNLHPPTLRVIATYSALAHRVHKLRCPQTHLNEEMYSKTIFNMSQFVGID